MRLDVYLSSCGAIGSRNKAQRMIEEGMIFVNGTKITRPSYQLQNGSTIEIKSALKYVGRGGLKLEGALKDFSVNPEDLRCIDIGASTGGFTDCLLQNGAKEVVAIDSGHGQLHSSLLNDSRVENHEGFNAKELDEKCFGKFDLAVMDVSFISQSLLYKNVCSVLGDNGIFISLIKPQFEVGKDNIGKNGIVKNLAEHEKVIRELSIKAVMNGLVMRKLAKSKITGGDGNIEYLALFTKEENTLIGSLPDINGVVYGKNT